MYIDLLRFPEFIKIVFRRWFVGRYLIKTSQKQIDLDIGSEQFIEVQMLTKAFSENRIQDRVKCC